MCELYELFVIILVLPELNWITLNYNLKL